MCVCVCVCVCVDHHSCLHVGRSLAGCCLARLPQHVCRRIVVVSISKKSRLSIGYCGLDNTESNETNRVLRVPYSSLVKHLFERPWLIFKDLRYNAHVVIHVTFTNSRMCACTNSFIRYMNSPSIRFVSNLHLYCVR